MLNGSVAEHLKINPSAYASGVLDPERHMQLVQELPKIIRIAGISEAHVFTALPSVPPEIKQWVRAYPSHKAKGGTGLALVGSTVGKQYLPLIVGAFLRNFIDARLKMVKAVISDSDATSCEVLCIPNFFVSGGAGTTPNWILNALVGVLEERRYAQRMTVVGIEDWSRMAADHGPTVAEIAGTYQRVNV